MKKVSIIIPVYNTEKYLKDCLDSVINQDYSNLEIIVVNDGSLGDTDNIIEDYLDKIKYFKRTNHGIGATRNYGIQNSMGDYLCFLDSDDKLKPGAISSMVEKCEKEKIDFLVTDYEDFYINNSKTEKILIQDFTSCSLSENPGLINKINLGPSNKLIKKDLLKDLSFPENIKYEDFALILKIMDKSKKIGHLKKSLFVFNKRDEGETLVVDKKVFDIFVSLKDVIKHFNGRYEEEINYFLVHMLTLYATKQKYQKYKNIKNEFIDEAYRLMKENVPNYKKNKYFKDCSFIKRIILKNKFLLKLYCK